MSLEKLHFKALETNGSNYLEWKVDIQQHLRAQSLLHALGAGTAANSTDGMPLRDEDDARALIFVRRHVHMHLKAEYLTVDRAADLWEALRERFDNQRLVILPQAQHDWVHLRLMDFPTVSAYNSALNRLASQLELCGDPRTDQMKIRKTLKTMHSGNLNLAEQYWERKFTRYGDLLAVLIAAEKRSQILLLNANSHPAGSAPPSNTQAGWVVHLIGYAGRGP